MAGPWQNQPVRPPSRARFLFWLAILLAGAVAFLALMRAFPDHDRSDLNTAFLIRMVGMLMLVSAAITFGRRIPLREFVRNALSWLGVAAVLAIGFTYQAELRTVGARLESALIPGYAAASNPGELVLTESAEGNFYVYAAVNGVNVKFLIDTGASDITISPGDAARIGIDLHTLDFAKIYDTANGPVLGASYTVRSLAIGPLALSDVPVSINQVEIAQSLLGMAFLKRMASVEIRGQQLILHLRGV